MNLKDFAEANPTFNKWQHVDKIKFFGWFLHSHGQIDIFTAAHITKCYDDLHLERPGNIHGQLSALASKKPRELLKSGGGYKLEAGLREALNNKYAVSQVKLQLTKILEGLPSQIQDIAQREYLDEAIKCFKVGSSRAAIVMTWNLAYSHLGSYILNLNTRKDAFNATWKITYPAHHKNKTLTIESLEDYSEELKESQMIAIAKNAGIISGDIYKILSEKLNRRNSAAHPSRVAIGQLQAEEFIDDLVKNVVLKLL